MDAERLAALRLAKLRALAPVVDAEGRIMAFGPVLRDGTRAWTMVNHLPALAGAAVWALRSTVAVLDAVVEPTEGVDPDSIAGAATLLARPEITVWRASVDRMDPIVARPPSSPMSPPVAPDRVEPLLAVLREHGVDPVVEEGVVIGEIAGLEVARIDLGGDEPVLSVGVGQFDRDLNDMVAEMEGTDPAVQLATAARAVGRHRRAGAPPHPLHRLRRERWLRSMLTEDPDLVACTRLVPVPPIPVDGLRVPSPAPALGVDHDGHTTLVVCSTGVDPTVALVAGELRRRYAPDARLVLAVPAADDYPITRQLAGALTAPAEVQPVPAPWLATR